MADALKEFELVINSSPKDFGEWLISESNEMFISPILYDENEWATFHSPKFHEPGEDSAHHRFFLNATLNSEVEIEPGDWSSHRTNIEQCVILEIRKSETDKIHVIGYWKNYPSTLALKKIQQKIVSVYNPIVIEDSELYENRLLRPDMDLLPILIFDFVLSTSPILFNNWIQSVLDEMINNNLSKMVPELSLEHPLLLNLDIDVISPDGNFVIYPFGKIIPSDKEFPHDYYTIAGDLVTVTIEEISLSNKIKVITGIEIREITENQIHIIGKCENIPVVLDLAEKLRSDIIRVFKPETESNKSMLLNQTEEIDKKIQPWERITDHLWDRKAVEMWWKGFTNKEIGQRVSIAARRVTNRISELRQIYGTDIVPTDKQRKKHLREKTRDTM